MVEQVSHVGVFFEIPSVGAEGEALCCQSKPSDGTAEAQPVPCIVTSAMLRNRDTYCWVLCR